MKKTLTLYEFFKERKIIHWLFVLVCEEIILIIFKDTLFLEKKYIFIGTHGIKNAYVIGVILLIVFIFIFFISYIKDVKKILNNEIDSVEEQYEKYNEVVSNLNNKYLMDEGMRLFNIAMALDTFEPNKIKLLSDATEKYHNIYAGMYIGNLFHSGLSNGSVVIVKKDYEKAFYYYNMVADYDYTGAVLWRIGWMYERKQIASDLSEEERKKKAFEYYKKSEEKNYVKAYNSIGKFYQNGWAVEKNLNEAIYYFRKATKLGDTFSILNEAYIHALNPNSFDLAVECFKKAMNEKTPLAYLKFGEFIENNLDYFSKSEYNFNHLYIFDLYRTITEINNGTVSARAFYSIGNLISKFTDIIIDKRDDMQKMFGNVSSDFVTEAYRKAKEIFEYNMRRNVKLSDTDIKIYYYLRDMLIDG